MAAAGSAAAGPLVVRDAWVRATPPGARTAAAYLTITNSGADDRLLGGYIPERPRPLPDFELIDESAPWRQISLKSRRIEPPAAERHRAAAGCVCNLSAPA